MAGTNFGVFPAARESVHQRSMIIEAENHLLAARSKRRGTGARQGVAGEVCVVCGELTGGDTEKVITERSVKYLFVFIYILISDLEICFGQNE